MSKQAFGKALEAMVNDSDAAAAMADGNFQALPELDASFTAAERALLQAAASEMPDVSGFSNRFLKVDYIGETEKNFLKLGDISGNFGPRFREASEYLTYKLED